jgi:hypothetical protein
VVTRRKCITVQFALYLVVYPHNDSVVRTVVQAEVVNQLLASIVVDNIQSNQSHVLRSNAFRYQSHGIPQQDRVGVIPTLSTLPMNQLVCT